MTFSCKCKTFVFSWHILGVTVPFPFVLIPWDKLHPWSIERNLEGKEESNTENVGLVMKRRCNNHFWLRYCCYKV